MFGFSSAHAIATSPSLVVISKRGSRERLRDVQSVTFHAASADGSASLRAVGRPRSVNFLGIQPSTLQEFRSASRTDSLAFRGHVRGGGSTMGDIAGQISPPLHFRRWSGQGRRRLHVRDATGRKLGFLDQVSDLLYVRDESDRGHLVRLLAAENIALTGPPVEKLEQLPWPYGAVCYPGRDHVKVYWDPGDHMRQLIGREAPDGTDDFLPVRLFALYHPDVNRLVVAEEEVWSDIVSLLRRGGHVTGPDPLPRTGASGLDAHLRASVDTEERMQATAAFYAPPIPPEGSRVPERDAESAAPPSGRQQSGMEVRSQETTCVPSAAALSSMPERLQAHLVCCFADLHRSHRHPGQGQHWSARNKEFPEGDPRRFELRLPSDLDAATRGMLDDLIEDYGGHFCAIAAVRAQRRTPRLWEWAADSWEQMGRPDFDLFGYDDPGVDPGVAALLAGAIYHATRDRRGWSRLRPRACGLCNERFQPSRLTLMGLRKQGGPARYCSTCDFGLSGTERWPDDTRLALESVRHLGEISRQLPQRARWQIPLPAGRPDGERDAIFAARVATPRWEAFSENTDFAGWPDVLEASGLLGGSSAKRRGRGQWSVAKDGHLCRSTIERTIDDHLSAYGIRHEPEPTYPYHPDFNPSGRKRADWLLDDGRYVEAAGLIADVDYAARLDAKRRLCAALGLDLVVLEPGDVHHLNEWFPPPNPGRVSQ